MKKNSGLEGCVEGKTIKIDFEETLNQDPRNLKTFSGGNAYEMFEGVKKLHEGLRKYESPSQKIIITYSLLDRREDHEGGKGLWT